MSDDNNYNGFIEGTTINLVPLNSNHAKIYNKWKNNAKVRRLARFAMPSMLEAEKKLLDSVEERQKEESFFEIWHKKDKRPIGIAGLHDISWLDKRGEIGLIIGEPEYWGKNIATETANLILKYGFDELNFHKIISDTVAPNRGSWSVSEKIGMKREAVLIQHEYVDGEYVDVYIYGIFKTDWLNRKRI